MLNRRFESVAVEPRALQARRAVAELFAQKLRELPPAPLDFSALQSWAPLPGVSELDALRRVAFSAAANQTQLELLWRETLATAFCAPRVACEIGAQASVSAAAALLHRIGDALALATLSRCESEAKVALDAPSRATLVAQQSADLAERTLRWWGMPAAVGATALGWRRFGEFPAGPKNCAAVYIAHLLATEWLQPGIYAPETVEAAAGELGLTASALAAARPDAEVRARLAKLLGAASSND
ncbi:MAG: HDOD domain-containing protein [Steroidobacteraceae bacterium]